MEIRDVGGIKLDEEQQLGEQGVIFDISYYLLFSKPLAFGPDVMCPLRGLPLEVGSEGMTDRGTNLLVIDSADLVVVRIAIVIVIDAVDDIAGDFKPLKFDCRIWLVAELNLYCVRLIGVVVVVSVISIKPSRGVLVSMPSMMIV